MKPILPLSFAFCVMAATAPAAVVDIAITSVAHIRQASGVANNNYGADGSLIVGRTAAPDTLRGLLATSLSAIPAGSTINSITLHLNISGTGSVDNEPGEVLLGLHQLTGTFTEGNGDGNGATPGGSNVEATWNQRSNGVPWTPGGEFNATELSTASDDPSTAEGTPGSGAEDLVFESTDAFVAAAQLALDTNVPLSLLLKLNGTSETEVLRRPFFFDSDDDGTDPSNVAPFFTVDYTIPEPASALLAVAGLLPLALRRRRISN